MSETKQNILFEKFEIIECFKKDDYTGVYLAKHIYLGKEIILKCLNTQTVPDNSVIERFKREAKILASLDHPNIIKVLDFGTHGKYFYISFEYFKGTSLREVIKKNDINDKDKKQIVIQILQGMHEAHSNNIIHRDIKPENIFVDHAMNVKIGDFGLALSKTESFVTSKSAIVGTPCYMSPEQVSGDVITPQTDLFSFGIVIYELFTGINPFLGNDVNESINNIITKDYKTILQELKTLPEAIAELVNNTIVRSNTKRCKSALEAMKMLGVEPSFNTIVDNNNVFRKKIKQENLQQKIYYSIAAATVLFLLIYVVFFVNKKESSKSMTTPESIQNETLNADSMTDSLQNNTPVSENNTAVIPTVDKTLIPANDGTTTSGNNDPERVEKPTENVATVLTFGELLVECSPWGNIIIDGTQIDTTPLEKPLRLETGEHKLVLSHPQFPSYRETISIKANALYTVKVNLDTLYGYVDCKVFPWGELYVNGEHIGQTPLANSLQLVPGRYTFRITNPHFATLNDTVVVRRNDTLSVKYSFKN